MTTPTYSEIMVAVQSRLNCGRERIADAPVGFRWTRSPSSPSLEARLLSDYGVSSNEPELKRQFRDEIAAITEALKGLGYRPKLTNWQKRASEARQRLMTSMNVAAEPLGLWDEISVPVRRKGDLAYRILAPRDVLGSPTINAIPVDVYIREVCEQIAKDSVEKAQLQQRTNRWRFAAIVLEAIFALVLIGGI